jgi:hypothetical protein
MSLPLKQFTASGVAITDEVVICNQAIIINSVTYYCGYLNYTCNNNIQGNTSSNYGVWSIAGTFDGLHLGTRYNVMASYPISGMPGNSSAISIDTRNGLVYATSACVVYVCYLAHDVIRYNANMLTVDVPYTLTAGNALTIAKRTFNDFRKFGYVQINQEGGLPSQSWTLAINVLDSLLNITTNCTVTSTESQVLELSTCIKIPPMDSIVLSTTNGYNAFGLAIELIDN